MATPIATAMVDPRDDGCELAAGVAECFEEREFASASSD